MNAYSLPGFDAWLTNGPPDPIEPSERDYDEARAQLGDDATEDEIEALAPMLASERPYDDGRDEPDDDYDPRCEP